MEAKYSLQIQDELRSKQDEITRLKAEVSRLNEENADLKHDKSSFRASNDRLNRELDRANEEINKERKEKGNALEKLAKSEEVKQELRETIVMLQVRPSMSRHVLVLTLVRLNIDRVHTQWIRNRN